MKKFFQNILTSFLGTWIALLFFGGVVTIIIITLIVKAGMSVGKSNEVKSDSVLVLDLAGQIIETEKSMRPDFSDLLNGEIERPATLDVLVEALKKGAEDDRVEAMYIKCNGVSAQPATLNSLRNAVLDFKKSGKKVYAYGNSLTESDYYVACAADSLFVNPQGNLILTGVTQVVPYMGKLFEKIGINFQIAKVGTYKSAVEPYIMDTMSEPARAQLDTLCGSLWTQYKAGISESRHTSPALIDSIVNSAVFFADVKSLSGLSLFDGICYEREMDQKFADLLDKDKDDINFITPDALVDIDFTMGEGEHIAILYASGEIAETKNAGINCEKLVPVIMSLKEDENVKGLVLRVNSPGGSVFGSEQIADALKQFKSTGKPFAVSMGDYAASGGYWISCDADRIFASPMTVTGSIGIFGIVPDCSPLLGKLGVSFQQVSTNPNGAFLPPYLPLTPAQTEAFQRMINEGYDKFIKRVANGRKLPEAKVRAIAEGRVWAGTDALKIGLVDQLGSLEEAVDWVGKKAGMKEISTGIYPSVTRSFWDFLADTEATPFAKLLSQSEERLDVKTLCLLTRILSMKAYQARMANISITL